MFPIDGDAEVQNVVQIPLLELWKEFDREIVWAAMEMIVQLNHSLTKQVYRSDVTGTDFCK